ncbi:PREDICTED: NDR1/HIN1-Like protein 3 [Camelina sativa]|uniref:NDR1/HIN1-Like protein 3 n=1 Tax=Camelina sativa TaxID=90675 RepID=A0ABM0V8J6_CAMSA|nr:PREDICTED: NDR1/HIN1-Like protein 3 [Camelina sativa]
MSDLNGAYYGPSIPPPKKVSHSHGRRGGGCGCLGDCLGCCGCCILSVIFNILIAIAVLLGIAALIIWLIFRPNGIKFHVTDAKLTEFTLDPATNNIRYNLELNFTIRNPNRRIGVYYDQIEVRGLYGDQRFGSSNISPFYQGHKNTTVVGTKLGGQQLVLLDGEDRKDLDEDVNSKIYRIDTKLRLRVRFKFGLIKSWRFKPNIKCELKVPLSNSTTSGFQFQRTKCDVDF